MSDEDQTASPPLTPEQKLVKQLEESEKELKEARLQLREAKKAVLSAETRMINAKLANEKLTEKLRLLRNSLVKNGESYASFDDEDSSG